MQFVFNQKVIIGNQEKNNTYIKKTSKIKGKRYVAREKMNFRFSHPLLLRSLKAFKIKAFRLFCFARKGQGTTQGTNFGALPKSRQKGGCTSKISSPGMIVN